MGFNSAFKGLKDNNRALVARLGPEINSQACLCVLQGPQIYRVTIQEIDTFQRYVVSKPLA
jgi:hypothetical protein